MKAQRIRLGTRSSPLALVQTELVKRAILAVRPELEACIDIVKFTTRGDQIRNCAIEAIGGRGVFTDELDQAVASGSVDLAVHSVKDLPVPMSPGLLLAATLEREDPREAFVSMQYQSLAAVPKNAVLGSASLRREALVKALRPDLSFTLLRGNVDERVLAIDQRRLSGTILAVAGLKRLGLKRHIREIFTPETLMPDPGQGAIGIVSRFDNAIARVIASRINHTPTQSAVIAERAFLEAAGGRFVVGALACMSENVLTLSAVAATTAGAVVWRQASQGCISAPVALAQRLAASLPRSAEQGRTAS
jgi:hydroxymethylbilane synthase